MNLRDKKDSEMNQEEKIERSIDFVGAHYREGGFDKKRAWRSLGAGRIWWRRPGAIAASVAAIVVAASACVLVFVPSGRREEKPVQQHQAVPVVEQTAMPVAKSTHIEFNDAPLPEVVEAIERTYGVKIENVPQQSDNITLSYDGTAAELVETLNTLLGCQMTISDNK